MAMPTRTLRWVCTAATVLALGSALTAAGAPLAAGLQSGSGFDLTQILGRPTDRSIALSVLAPVDLEAFVEYGPVPGKYAAKTAAVKTQAGQPFELEIDRLEPNTRYYYRLRRRQPGETGYTAGTEYTFHTQRSPGATFTFALQGDSHPERLNRMYDPDLYVQTMRHVEQDRPDFYLTLGDDFSIEHLIGRNTLSQQAVDQVYAGQRSFLGLAARSASLFLVNGNHEEAMRYLLDGTPNNPSVLAGRARTRFYPLPAPDAFYGGDSEQVKFIGLLRDYYAWTWGDVLFVVIDPYWHSPVQVDADAGGDRGGKGEKGSGGKVRDMWGISIGDAQYQWLKQTLEQSKAKYKFIFTHQVLGTGRGGVELAEIYEWGGKNKNGIAEFGVKRSGWELPIHQLMVKTGVTIFFHGHDHLFARQERDGVIYQEVANPADATYQAFNREAYRSGDILPNSGHLRVTVAPEQVRVDYVRSYLPQDETGGHKSGEVAFSYTVKAAAR